MDNVTETTVFDPSLAKQRQVEITKQVQALRDGRAEVNREIAKLLAEQAQVTRLLNAYSPKPRQRKPKQEALLATEA